MKAIVRREYGSADVLRLEEIEKPAPAPREILIRVHAASVNPLDWHLMRGTPKPIRLFAGLRRPKKPRLGVDFAGTIEAIGGDVTQFRPGDAVFGACDGAFAEYVCAPASSVVKKPDRLSFVQAAAVAIGGLTALQALRDKGHVQPGQKVLINGAAGGVGTFAVQIAKWIGATVTGVCSTANVEMVRHIGADLVVDYTQEDFAAAGRIYDVIFDLVGNRSLTEFRRVLGPTGTFISCGGGGPDKRTSELLGPVVGQMVTARFTRQKLVGILAKRDQADLQLLSELMDSGKVTPVIDHCYGLAQTAEAVRYLELGHARGKVVITVDSEA